MQPEARPSCRAVTAARAAGIAALLAILLTAPAAGMELQHLEITTGKGFYRVDMTFSVAATPGRVIAVLTDYRFPDRLNPDVTAREVLDQRDGTTRVRTDFHGCALFLCEDVTLVQDVAVTTESITADVVPGQGDFTAGRLHWRIVENEAGGSDVEFRASMEYDFFVVPLFGRMLLRNRLRHQLLETATNLEAEASRQID